MVLQFFINLETSSLYGSQPGLSLLGGNKGCHRDRNTAGGLLHEGCHLTFIRSTVLTPASLSKIKWRLQCVEGSDCLELALPLDSCCWLCIWTRLGSLCFPFSMAAGFKLPWRQDHLQGIPFDISESRCGENIVGQEDTSVSKLVYLLQRWQGLVSGLTVIKAIFHIRS